MLKCSLFRFDSKSKLISFFLNRFDILQRNEMFSFDTFSILDFEVYFKMAKKLREKFLSF